MRTSTTTGPDDQIDCTLVFDEVKTFVRAELGLTVVNSENITIILTNRLTPHSILPIECSSYMNFTLQEALIINGNFYQVKGFGLTMDNMDIFYILQIIQREPTHLVPHLFQEPPCKHYTSSIRSP
ncbi:protein SCAI-like [Epargyreus clarus]|uniref:protein SCAI-like n=1 Tax=Epargyreus clarus TaxID=520877 RepID=UPI003C2FCDA6